jgi:ABC-type sugar transport system ATPase subunit
MFGLCGLGRDEILTVPEKPWTERRILWGYNVSGGTLSLVRVELDNLCKTYPGAVHALRTVSLDVAPGECIVLLGPSASGKTTLLRLVAGLEEPTSGEIRLDGRDVRGIPPHRRNVGFVFQDATLYPHLTLARSIALASRNRDSARRVAEVAATFGIADVLGRRPGEVSGGQRRRAALARELVRAPALFLLDEPTSGLDPHLADDAREDIAAIRQSLRCTTIIATHDRNEAFRLADRVAIMRDGIIIQTGPPRDVQSRPADRFVAAFLSSPGMGFIAGTLAEGLRFIPTCGLPAVVFRNASGSDLSRAIGRTCFLALRPECVRLHDGPWALPVHRVETLADQTIVHLGLPDGTTLAARTNSPLPAPGQVVAAGFDAALAQLFETGDNGRRLNVDLSP